MPKVKNQLSGEVATYKALAEAIDCDEKSIQRWSKEDGWPGRNISGNFNVESVKEWLVERGGAKTATGKAGIERERAARIAKLEAQTAILLRKYIPRDEVDQTLANVAVVLKRELDRARLELSTRLIGMTAAQANAELDSTHKRILNRLSTEKWME